MAETVELNDPSPTMATTGRSGCATFAPTAAPFSQPIVERPLAMSIVAGDSTE
jgi:hypothetical protein